MDNHSLRFRRSFVAHYLSAQAEWARPTPARGSAIMWVRGMTFPDKVHEVERDILSIPESA